MKRACVLGFPAKQSLSPVIHRYWLQKHGIEGDYVIEEVAPGDLRSFIQSLMANGYCGANLTLPHKEAILPLLDRIEDAGRAIGAVNTIWLDSEGLLHGDNSDMSGFFDHLTATHPDWKEHVGSALVIGAGGAARAILYGLRAAGVPSISVANRSIDRARTLIDELAPGADAVSLSDTKRSIAGQDLIINTTSLGMTGQPELPVSLDQVASNAIVCDIVYKPRRTGLLAEAESRGVKTLDGLGMLLHQACLGFEHWFGVKPRVDAELRDRVLAHLEP